MPSAHMGTDRSSNKGGGGEGRSMYGLRGGAGLLKKKNNINEILVGLDITCLRPLGTKDF